MVARRMPPRRNGGRFLSVLWFISAAVSSGRSTEGSQITRGELGRQGGKRMYADESPWYLGKRGSPDSDDFAWMYSGKRARIADESPWYLGKRNMATDPYANPIDVVIRADGYRPGVPRTAAWSKWKPFMHTVW